MDRFMKWLMLIDSLFLSSLYIAFLLNPSFAGFNDFYFSPWELYFVVPLLVMLIPMDRYVGTRQEVLAFVLLAFLTGFELVRSQLGGGNVPLPQPLYSAVKSLVFASSCGVFYHYRYEKAWSSLISEGGKETDSLFRYATALASMTFMLGGFLHWFLFPIHYGVDMNFVSPPSPFTYLLMLLSISCYYLCVLRLVRVCT